MAIPTSGYSTASWTNPSSAITDFTGIIDLSLMDADFKSNWNTSEQGRGRAAKDDGVTELACDWIDLDHVAKTGLLRVKWSGILASSGTQVIRIYPPNTANTAYGVSDPYGQYNAYITSNFAYLPDGSTTDRTSSGNTATRNGSVVDATGQIGTASDYGGTSSDYARAPDDASQDPGSAGLSMGCWVKFDDLTETRQSLIHKYDTAGDEGAYFLEKGSADRFDTLISGNGLDFTFSRRTHTFNTTDWVFVFAVWESGETTKISINGGTLGVDGTSGSIQTTVHNSTAPLDFGRSTYSTTRALSGKLNQVQIYKETLTQAFIDQEYSQTNDNAIFWGTWTWNSASTSYTIDADTGTFSISGSDVGLLANREITAESGNYNITGSAVDLLATRLIGADSGTYNLVGSDVSLDYLAGFTLDADSGTFTINGSDVELERTYVLNADSGDYDLTGSDVQLIWSGQPLANGYVCMALSGKTPQIIYTAKSPEIAIGGKGCK